MNNVIQMHNASQQPTMSSLELVDFINGQRKEGETELRHDHFMAKVPKVLGEEVAPNFRAYYTASNGKQNPCYHFPKREACLMAMSYSYELQAKVFDKMTALEAQQAQAGGFHIPQSMPEALRLAADLAEGKAQAEAALAIAAPKAEALDRIAAGDENVTMTQAAKVLSIKRDTLTQWLHANGWVYRQNGSWVAYDAQIRTGRLAYKEAKYTDDTTGQEVHRPYCHITPKGLAWLAENGPKSLAA